MAKKDLLDVIFASDKRKNVLLLLEDGTLEMETILESLEATRQALLPQIKVLEEHHLISRLNDSYKLTTIGEVIAEEMKPLLETIDIFEKDMDYWGTRKLDLIPAELLETINKLKKCSVVTPHLVDMYSVPEIYSVTKETSETVDKFTEASIISKYYGAITTFLYPNTDEILAEMLDNNVNVSFIVYENLLGKISTEFHASFKELLKNPLFNLYVINEMPGFLSCASTNSYFLMRLLNNKGEYDSKYILCSSPSALQWGKDVIEHYLKDALPVNEL